jgi:hypothetical protein
MVLRLTSNANSPEWLVSPEQYTAGVVGNKSASLGLLGFSTTLSSYAMLSESMVGEDLKAGLLKPDDS